MTETKVQWSMECNVNEVTFSFNGEGKGNSTTGQLDMHYTADKAFPEGFDPVSCPSICNAALSLCFARIDQGKNPLLEASENNFKCKPARVGIIFDEQDKKILDLSIFSTVVLEGDTLTISSKMNGFSDLPAIEKNIVPYHEYTVPAGIGEATGVVRFKLFTVDGRVLPGMTIIPYQWQAPTVLKAPFARTLEQIDVSWDGGMHVHSRIKSKFQPQLVESLQLDLATTI